MKVLHMVAFGLLVVGGLNWLLVASGMGWDIGTLLGEQGAMVSRVIYVLVGLAAIWEVVMHAKTCKMCGTGGTQTM